MNNKEYKYFVDERTSLVAEYCLLGKQKVISINASKSYEK